MAAILSRLQCVNNHSTEATTTAAWYLSATDTQIDGLVQERRNSSALAMELRLSWY